MNDNQDEEVQHDVRANQHESVEVQLGELTTAGLFWDAVWWCAPAIKHDKIPILTCGQRKQEKEGIKEVVEVLQIIEYFAFGNLAKHENAKDREHEEDKHEQHGNIKNGRDGEQNGLNDSLEALCLTKES